MEKESKKELELLTRHLWKIVCKGIKLMEAKDAQIAADRSAKEKFEKRFLDMYAEIKDRYMDEKTETLDRHKVAAILLIAVIEADILESRHQGQRRFVGNYILASDSAFSYMLSELNRELARRHQGKIVKYIFPDALACETDYYRIFYRNLFYIGQNEAWTFNPLDLSERLFLLEYLTLKENGIDINALKEYK